MRILHIIDRVFTRLLLGQFQIKFQLGIGTAAEKDKSGDIFAHFIHDLAERDKSSATGRHGHRLSFPQQADQLHQENR